MASLLSVSFLAFSLASSALGKPLSTAPHYVAPSRPPLAAPLLGFADAESTINNSYIVMLKSDVQPSAMSAHLNLLQSAYESDPLFGDDSGLKHVYDGHIKGYAGMFTENVLSQIRAMPEVDYVERDQIVSIMDPIVAPAAVHDIEHQSGSPWGLARVSHRNKLNFSTFRMYEYDPSGGEGVDVYVIDTGINIDHVEFEGRALWGKTIPQNDIDEDGNGHGTHCAGTIASRKYGVAKAAHVIAVKVLGSNGSGSMSDVVAGVVYAASAAKTKAKAAAAEYAATGKTKHKGSVANMSLGGGKSTALDDAVNKAVRSGLHFAVAAGNDDRDACNYSPAAAELAVTVGASTLADERAYFSNHGPCVDVFAPGLNILSTWTGSPTVTSTISGTSMASPHTAGMLAYLLSIYPSATFDPDVSHLFFDAIDNEESPVASLYTLVYAVLPNWVASFLPPPQFVSALAPVPKQPTLTPLQLKTSLLKLASKDRLATLPAETVNLLIFNNATSS